MRAFHKILSATALTSLSVAAQATDIYSSASIFATKIAPGAYTEEFNDPSASVFSGSGYSYTAFATSGIFLDEKFLSTNQVLDSLTLSFTGRPVTAIGGNFFSVDLSNNFQPDAVTITLSDGTTTTFEPGSQENSFKGFISTIPITSLVVSGPGDSFYVSIDNLTVGRAVSAVPEPATWALMAFGSATLLAAARRRKA